MEKDRIRREMKRLRNNLYSSEIETLSDIILEKLMQIDLSGFDKVFIYNSFGGEVDTNKAIKWLLEEGKSIYLPRVEGDVMQSVKITTQTSFNKSPFGILEPEGMASKIDKFVAIMPCLAVDKYGNRIGYGGGYYDKFLKSKSSLKIVLCYDFQIIDEIVSNEHDIKVDYIVTDKKVIKLRA